MSTIVDMTMRGAAPPLLETLRFETSVISLLAGRHVLRRWALFPTFEELLYRFTRPGVKPALARPFGLWGIDTIPRA